MRDVDNPPRLFESEEAPAELRTWLCQAHEDVLSIAETEQLVHAVEARVNTQAGLHLPPSTWAVRSSWLARTGRHSTKLLAAVALIGLGVGGWFLATRKVESVAEPAAAAPQLEKPRQRPDNGQAPSPARDTMVAPAVPSAVDQATAPATTKAPRLVHARARDRETVHRVSVRAEPRISPPDGAGTDEFRLLRAARQAIGDRPERALALTDEHAQRFPSGMLGQEREAIAIEALVKLGRAAQAKARARSFFAAHPGSPYGSRIETAIGHLAEERKAP